MTVSVQSSCGPLPFHVGLLFTGWEALGNPGWNWQTLLDISKVPFRPHPLLKFLIF